MQYKDFYKDVSADNISEDYPSTWSKDEFKKINSFNGKLKYADQHLKKLATGSGRAVFDIDGSRVLKIAKNIKGLAQNSVEAEPYIQQYDITTMVFDRDDQEVKDTGPFWIESEKAKKLSPRRFEELTGVSLKDVNMYLTKMEQSWRPKISPEVEKILEENEFIQDVFRFMADYDMPSGDLGRISSYGEVIRDGKPKVVLVDYGLTKKVFDDFYRVKM